ncbi:MAG: FAD-dependent oxidoreductase [Bacillati bacterium ANGP1]|uniref:FAD-dependent oxidoreductase n=1 Tax=Candidatus Segetimicrobium genomatis TaxID=2569760 RepID=A0A537JMX3_9BACT|nr:MAG: FAD-dependent oxidoreductase [Terrabacteria group bacterium ANGP1]
MFGGPDSHLARLVDEAGLETKSIPGNRMGLAVNGKVVASGAPETYPLRLPLSPAARLSFIKSGLKLRWAAQGFQRAARRQIGESASAARARELAYRENETFADYLGVMHPEVEAIFRAIAERITAEPHEITAGCGAGLFAVVWDSNLTLARNLIGGSALLPLTLARHLGSRIVTGAAVEEVVPEPTGARIRVRVAGRVRDVSAKYVIAATPAYVTHRIVRGLPADTADALARIPYGPFVCGAVLTGESGPMPWDDVYAIATPGKAFNMLFNHANVLRGSGPREPGGSLMVYGGGDLGRRLLQMTDGQIQEAFLRDLSTILPEVKDVVREVIVHRWEHAIPYIAPGRHRLQPALERSLGNVLLAGDYLGFPEMEVAAVTGLEAARTARGGLAPVEGAQSRVLERVQP